MRHTRRHQHLPKITVDYGSLEVYEPTPPLLTSSYEPKFSWSGFLFDLFGLVLQCALFAAAFTCFAYSFAMVLRWVLR